MRSALPIAWRRALVARVAAILSVAGLLEGRLAAQQPVPAKVYRYAQRLVEQYDRDGDGKLQEEEWKHMRGQPARVDANGDGIITTDELTQWIVNFGAQRNLRLAQPATETAEASSSAEAPSSDRANATEEAKTANELNAASERALPSDQSPPATSPKAAVQRGRFHVSAKRLPPGLPPWFLQRDVNGDGQIALSEFAPKATAEDRREFSRHDFNGDGVITPQECTRNVKPSKSAKPKTP